LSGNHVTGECPVKYPVRLLGLASAFAAFFSLLSAAQAAPASSGGFKVQRDGSLSMGGRTLRCGGARSVLDGGLPSEGAAAPGVLIINPRLLNRMPHTVRLFVFYHECGHHRVGGSELRADSWAVRRGVAEGWLDRNGLRQVCRSFGNMPATPTHPSARARCQNLERTFNEAIAARAPAPKRKPANQIERAAGASAPALLNGPKLVGSGRNRTARN